jgi:hypothetical protein
MPDLDSMKPALVPSFWVQVGRINEEEAGEDEPGEEEFAKFSIFWETEVNKLPNYPIAIVCRLQSQGIY